MLVYKLKNISYKRLILNWLLDIISSYVLFLFSVYKKMFPVIWKKKPGNYWSKVIVFFSILYKSIFKIVL